MWVKILKDCVQDGKLKFAKGEILCVSIATGQKLIGLGVAQACNNPAEG